MNGRQVYVALQQFCEQDDRPLQLLLKAGFQVRQNELGRRLRREEMGEILKEAEAVLAGVEPYDGELLTSLPRLRLISRCGVGTDSVDLEAARRRGITILNTAEEVIEPVAQLTLALILALARNLPQHIAEARAGLWKKRTGSLLSEWTIGLVGFGRIGRAVERYLSPLGVRLLAADPNLKPHDLPSHVRLLDLPSLLEQADLVSLHAAYPSSQGALMGRQELARMKPGSYLVNTSRGFLVDEAALLEALQSGRLAGAALDVFEEEPYRGPLAQLPQVIVTPHVATLTRASRVAMEYRCAQNVVDFFSKN